MRRIVELLRFYPIPVIIAITVSGFFLSHFAFVKAGGDAEAQDFISPPALVALIVIVLTFGVGISFYKWAKYGKDEPK